MPRCARWTRRSGTGPPRPDRHSASVYKAPSSWTWFSMTKNLSERTLHPSSNLNVDTPWEPVLLILDRPVPPLSREHCFLVIRTDSGVVSRRMDSSAGSDITASIWNARVDPIQSGADRFGPHSGAIHASPFRRHRHSAFSGTMGRMKARRGIWLSYQCLPGKQRARQRDGHAPTCQIGTIVPCQLTGCAKREMMINARFTLGCGT